MQQPVAVVMLIDDLMMDRRIDFEIGDALKLVLTGERNPRFEMICLWIYATDFRMIGEAEMALGTRRGGIAGGNGDRREHRHRANPDDDSDREVTNLLEGDSASHSQHHHEGRNRWQTEISQQCYAAKF